MHDYLFGPEVVRLAFVAGVVVSLVVYQRHHLTTGSIVVPGYMGLFLFLPLTVLATFANALTTYWLVNKVLRRRIVLYGRDKFAVQAVISIAIQAIMLDISPRVPWLWESSVPLLVGVGYVIPALVAHDMARQGIRKTTAAVLGSGLVVSVVIGLALILLPGVRATRPLVGFEALAFDPHWIPFAVLLSAATAWGLLKNHSLRAGGFIGTAYLAVLTAGLAQIAFLMAVALVSWFFVTRTLMRTMILFGRRKFAAMMVVSGITSWTLLWMGSALFGFEITAYQNLSSVALMPVFVPGLLANDMERSGPHRVVLGSMLGIGFVLPATLFVEGVVDRSTVFAPLAALAILAGLVVFEGQWRPRLVHRMREIRTRLARSGRHARSRWMLGAVRGRHVRPRYLRAT